MATRRNWHKADIKAEVEKRGTNLTALALQAGLSESTCRAALLRSQPQGERVLADFLGVSLHQLWPKRYSRDGQRLKVNHERDESKSNRVGAHRLLAEAN